jgi:hypothetical protein
VITLALTLALGTPAIADDLFDFQDPAITESSAEVEVGQGPTHRVLTINDSGHGPYVYVVDPSTGRTVGRSTYAGDAVDVEALTPGGDGSVWVGDVGDNGAVRADVQVYRLPPLTDGEHHVPSTRYDLVYRDGARDAETLLVDPRSGRVFVVSKAFLGGKVYAAPSPLRSDRPNQLVPVGPAPGVVTDGAFFPDGRHVVLRDYSRAYVLDTTRLPWRAVDSFELPDQPQGEGVAVRPGGRALLVSTEGEGQPVTSVPIPPRVLAELAPAPTSAPAPTPADDGDGESSRLDALTKEGAVPWTLVGGVVGVCVVLGLVFRVRRRRLSRARAMRRGA